ncbi:putative gluconokinase [Exophiala dermatitidis]
MLSAGRAPAETSSLLPFRTALHTDLVGDLMPKPSQPPKVKTIFIVGGPAGCGKTTVASYLSRELGILYLEGDDYHTPANKVKMGNSIPLNDGDRWDWLITLRNAATKELQRCNSIIVTCSFLKRKYRDVFRVASYNHPTVKLHFIYLKADEENLQARVRARVGHYMKESMVRSQLESLEEPGEDESDVIKFDVQRDREVIYNDVLATVRAKLEECTTTPTINGHDSR